MRMMYTLSYFFLLNLLPKLMFPWTVLFWIQACCGT